VGNWTIKAMHRETQDTLTRMDATTKDTLRSLGDGMTTMDNGLKTRASKLWG
jgi:hypothetical protein